MSNLTKPLPENMNAMVLMGHGDMDMLVWHENWPVPKIGAGEALIRVLACGLNNTDVNTRTAWYSKGTQENTTGGALEGVDEEDATWGGAPVTFPRIQGADVVGEVVAGPQEIIGKRVMIETWVRDWNDPLNPDKTGYFGSEYDGGFAQYTKADLRNVFPVESTLSDAELATFATSYVTAENMLNRADVGVNDTVLIPGASGGVGGALIQLAKRRGARTIAMASEAKHADVAKSGPDRILGRAPENLKALLASERITVVADVVGGDQWPVLIDVLERRGRYTCAGAIAGPMVEMDLRTFYLRDLTFTGATVVPPGVFGDLVGYIENAEISPILAATYSLRDLAAAQSAFISKTHTGNIVVVP